MYQLLLILLATGLVAIDQFTKHLVVQHLYPYNTVSLWDGVLELCYSENRGIAWGLMQNQRWLIIAATAIMLLVLFAFLMSGRFKESCCLSVGGVLIFAGGIGNLIDRAVNGFVVDFIHYYKWFDFPVFNFADCCVTIGAALVLIYVFFFIDKKEAGEEASHATVSIDSDSRSDGHTP